MKSLHGRDLTGEDLAQLTEEFVNGALDSENQKFAIYITERSHRTLQQSIMGLFMRTIELWAARATNPNHYDLRNAATVKLAAKMVAATGDQYDRFLPLI